MKALTFLAKRFVAGEHQEKAVDAVKHLNAENIHATLDILGENVSNEEEAVNASEGYLRLLDGIASEKIDSHVSLKLTQMGLDISNDFCFQTLEKIVTRAAQYNNFVRIDMEGSEYTQRTLDIYHRLFQNHKNVGIVIQAYLRRTEDDIRRLGSLKAPVRICKGAYKESPNIAFQRMDDIRRNFKLMAEILWKEGSHVAMATHDDQLIDWTLEYTAKENIPREQYEFQMLYGLRRKRARELAKAGHHVRLYVPYGTHWFPYFYRRLRERKENVFFVLKSLVAD